MRQDRGPPITPMHADKKGNNYLGLVLIGVPRRLSAALQLFSMSESSSFPDFQPDSRSYSYRIAATGFSRAALRAGNQQAKIPTATSTTLTTTSKIGSDGDSR